MKKYLTLLVFGFLLFSGSIYSQSWNWEVGKGGNNGRYGLADCVLGPLSSDDAWEINAAYSINSYQTFTNGDTVVVERTHNPNDFLHGSKLYAYNILSGEQIWSIELPIEFPETDYLSSVCGMNDSLVFATRTRGSISPGYLYALNIDDGSIVWQSEDLIEINTEDFIYADNGDMIVGNMYSVRRVNVIDGTTVWESPRVTPTTCGGEYARYNDHIYGWEVAAGGPKISVFDINTGEHLYESRPIGGGFIQQIAPVAGPNGMVYAPRSQKNPVTDTLVAFYDTGTELMELWSLPMGWVPLGTHGIGPDGSFYMYSRDFELLRISPDKGIMASTSINYKPEPATHINLNNSTGSIAAPQSGVVTINYYKKNDKGDPIPADTSITIADPDPMLANFPRMAIDSEGNIFLSNGQNNVFCFDYELNTIWLDNVSNIGSSGFALAKNGNLALATKGNLIKVYPGRGICGTFPVTFYVHDQYNGPLEGAVVNIDDESVTTDENGEAVFNLDEGEISYIVSYQEAEITGDYLVSSEPNQTIDVEFVITSMDENDKGTGNIYPNPTSGIIKLTTIANTMSISVTDITGKIIFYSNNTNEKQIDISNFENGIYLICIQTENGCLTKKIIKN